MVKLQEQRCKLEDGEKREGGLSDNMEKEMWEREDKKRSQKNGDGFIQMERKEGMSTMKSTSRRKS